MTSLKGAAYNFRSEVLLALHAAGFGSATKPREYKGLDPAERVHGDILGVQGVTIATRNQRDLALSKAVDEAKREADHEGNALWVVASQDVVYDGVEAGRGVVS